jgi:puromycin-sensitive aminopeptidase
LRAEPTRARPGYRLDSGATPTHVDLHVEVDPAESDRYRGEVVIRLRLARGVRRLRLHAVDLRVSGVRLEAGGETHAPRCTPHPEVGMLELTFARPIPAGAARLRLAFAGRLRRDLCGLYRARSGRHRFAFTQLEATDARKFFPCFDEPAFKARFRISVTTGRRHSVISNGPIERTTQLPRGRKRVDFAETPPLSTYLVALAVGPLEASAPVRLGRTPIRVWSAPGKRGLTAFALEAARESLRRLERYFGLPYPYAKLDLVAVPDFEFGAMENAGAVFFRETLLLLDPATATLAERKRAAEVIAHELAHMWYGDLVTMAWWDDLWLNEAFATWMAFAVVDAWKPGWRMWHDFQHGRAAALELDGLRHTHPIWCEVRTAEDASSNFDVITYEKGAAVVRMLERYLGPAAFRRGVRAYIRRHREGNTRAADLWRALSQASGEPVERMARAWIEQPGYPMLSLELGRERGRTRLELTQTRFLARAAARPVRGARRWPIPWVGRVGGGGRPRLARKLLVAAHERLDLGRGPVRFVYGNADEGGFFRPLHSETELRALAASLPELSAVERMGLVDHHWALVRAGRADLGDWLALAGALGNERDPDVLLTLRRPLGFLRGSLIPDAAPACAEPFERFVAHRFGPAFAALGWEPSPGETEATRVRRSALLGLVGGVAGEPAVIAEAAQRCERYLADRRGLDPNLADAVVSLAARAGDARRQRRFERAMQKAATPQEQRRFLFALADFTRAELVDHTLSLSLTDAVATQDVIFLLVRLLANPAARDRTWAFVQRRWPRLRRRMPSLLASRLIEATPGLLTPAHRRSVAGFFASHPVPGGARALRQALERFDAYRGFRRPAAAALERFLRAAEPRRARGAR